MLSSNAKGEIVMERKTKNPTFLRLLESSKKFKNDITNKRRDPNGLTYESFNMANHNIYNERTK